VPWPAVGLPPSFGQRSAEPERPAVARPGPESGYGGYRPLGSLPPSGLPPEAETSPQEGGAGPQEGGAGPQAAGAGPEDAFGPWETYETGEGEGWTGGYGIEADQGWARSYEDDPGQPYDEAQPYGRAPGGGAAPGEAAYYGHVGTYRPREDAGPAAGGHAPGPAGGAHPPGGPHPAAGTQSAYGTMAPGTAAPVTAVPGTVGPPGHGEQPAWQAESADSLTADLLLRGRHAAPPSGWRRALYQVTGGMVRAPQSGADRRRQDLVQRARTPVAGGHHRVAVLSLKGGVGKTTTTVGLGATLASLRGDRIIAVDANPDRGTLSDKLRLETAATVRDLLNEEDHIQRYADVRAYTTQAPSGLEVLASDRDPTVSVAFSAQDYEDVARVLEHYYSVSITDCGTGLLHSAMAGVLHLADQIVLVSSPSVDGARSASATLDWLAAHQYGDLVRGAVVVLSAIRPRSKSAVDLARLEQHFAARCRAVVRIPYDAHLEEGAEVDLALLSRATADAYLVLAAEVGDGFSWPRH
jgi:MinD-like ATPase involved in chromosome partitioning or flagellar assembly